MAKKRNTSAKTKAEDYDALHKKAERLEALLTLSNQIRAKERRLPITFNDFLYMADQKPQMVFRDIFQLFHDMVHYYVPEGIDEYHSDESIGFMFYDFTNLFIKDCDEPFLADRLFGNRLMNMADGIRKGTQNNRIYIFEGPPGSGKSTFLNNLLQKFEDYSKTEEGATYKIYWRLDVNALGGFQKFERLIQKGSDETQHPELGKQIPPPPFHRLQHPEKYVEFSCPNHDHPILIIPKCYRKDFLEELISDKEFKAKLFNDKEYEWVLKDVPCSICSSIYKSLLDELGDPLKVFDMVHVRRNYFNRQFGEGISVFNPGDQIYKKFLSNPVLQNMLNDILKNDDVKFVYSYLTKTNNGILGLMDIKEHNIERLKNFHGIISDGVHKVELSEEHIKTLFLGLVNPEDKMHYDKIQSFRDRIFTVKINYVLDYITEVKIYKYKFGKKIKKLFLPRVLENFAKIIISTRLDPKTVEIRKWIKNPSKYSKYMDTNLLLLKMYIYTGKIPDWLHDDDIKAFTKDVRKAIIRDSEDEGNTGISGRLSLHVFNQFLSKYGSKDRQITMDMVRKYFEELSEEYKDLVPKDFIEKLIDLYDYNVLQEVKEAIYFYNEEQIGKDILNYLYSINFEAGETKVNEYTNKKIEISEDFMKNFEAMLLGTTSTEHQRKEFRSDMHKEYISRTLSQEIRLQGTDIRQTEQFRNLFDKYTRNIKENSLAPYAVNANFRRAIKDFGSSQFNTYDSRLRRDIIRLIEQLQEKFGYSEIGARQVSLYVLDKDLVSKY